MATPTLPGAAPAPALATSMGLAANDDRAAVEAWLAEYGNARTQITYRRVAKRLLVWSVVLRRPLAAMTRQDWVRFAEVLGDRQLAQECARHIDVPDLRSEFEEAFLREPRGRPQPAHPQQRVARTLTIARVLLSWLRDHGHIATIALPRQRGVARPREDVMRERVTQRLLNDTQLRVVLDTLQAVSWARPEDARMLFVVTWLLWSGARRAELATASTGDFVLLSAAADTPLVNGSSPQLYWVATGKGNKRREVPVTRGMLAVWERYRLAFGRPSTLPIAPDTPIEPLVLPLRGREAAIRGGRATMSGETIWMIARRFAEIAAARAPSPADAARIRVASPHWYRHQLATMLLDAGRDMRDAQALLGHASITTTAVYQHVRHARLAQMMDSLEQTVLGRTSQPPNEGSPTK